MFQSFSSQTQLIAGSETTALESTLSPPLSVRLEELCLIWITLPCSLILGKELGSSQGTKSYKRIPLALASCQLVFSVFAGKLMKPFIGV